ncbi:DUF3592 domain-containing protein [Streptomyces cellostaticus]|uniref:DUF3592 domain-containing protein n=1 Tax=Streptomyces cellostaticus TaxID=67285 RepID=UPI0020266D6C|nr:DUF3592 domain-containing protein [Streptomyces cellostaticus]
MSRPDSVIFEGRGGSLRLDGGTVSAARGGTTVMASLRAVHHVDVEESGGRAHVHLHITEEGADGSRSTTAYTVRDGNGAAAHAFRRVVTAAVEHARRDPEARAEVRRVEAPGWSPRKRRWVTVTVLYAGLVIGVSAAVDGPARTPLFVLHVGLAFLGVAGVLLWPLVVLTSRGVSVRADVVRYHHLSRTVRPRYRYTTADGVVITADSAVQLFSTHASDRVDVTYDPHRPEFVACRSALHGHRHIPEFLCAALGLWWTLASAAQLTATAAAALTH